MPPICNFIRSRRLARRAQTCATQDPEKQTKRPRDWLTICAIPVRLWQWISSFIVYASLALLVQNAAGTVLDNKAGGIETVQGLTSASFAYHTTVLVFLWLLKRLKAGRRFFTVSTVLGDLLLMGLAIATMTAVDTAGELATCEGFSKSDYFDYQYMRRLAAAYSMVVFGEEEGRESNDELASLCGLPKTIYALSVVAIFSYTCSLVLTTLQVQQSRISRVPERDVEEALPVFTSYTAPEAPAPEALDLPRETPQCTNTHPEILPPSAPRSSQETTSSFNPDLYLVSDGFRRSEEPPPYTSRPSSLYNNRQT